MVKTSSLPTHTWLSSLSKVAIAVLGVAGILLLQVPQLKVLRGSQADESTQALEQAVRAKRLRLDLLNQLPAFGFDNLVADFTFLNFLQYFGDEPARIKTGYALSPEYFEVILDRDPYYLDFYLFLTGSTSLYAGLPEQTVTLIEKTLPSLSPSTPANSYYVWRYKGIEELLFLGKPEAARASFEKAAEWAETHSDPESQSVAESSRQTAQFLAENSSSRAAQISAWSMVLSNALDQPTRELAMQRIQELGGRVEVDPSGAVRVSVPSQE